MSSVGLYIVHTHLAPASVWVSCIGSDASIVAKKMAGHALSARVYA